MPDVTHSLTAAHQLAYTYKRSLGPVLGRFFTGLRDKQIHGVRRADGKVFVLAREYDPETGDAMEEMVAVADAGVVVSWAWVKEPRPSQPLAKPFAYALIRLDDADTPLLHAVDAGSEAAMSTGMRVKARWIDEPAGAITDIACFEPG